MSRDLVTIGPDARVNDMARTMLEHGVHRALVCEDRVLLGVVSAFELLRVLTRVPASEPLDPAHRLQPPSR